MCGKTACRDKIRFKRAFRHGIQVYGQQLKEHTCSSHLPILTAQQFVPSYEILFEYSAGSVSCMASLERQMADAKLASSPARAARSGSFGAGVPGSPLRASRSGSGGSPSSRSPHGTSVRARGTGSPARPPPVGKAFKAVYYGSVRQQEPLLLSVPSVATYCSMCLNSVCKHD